MIKKVSLIFVLVFSQSFSSAIYVEKLMGAATPEYRKAYFERMWKWYNKEFYDFSKKFSENETKLINLWKENIDEWGVEINENFYKTNFSFSHKINEKNENHSIFYIGRSNWSKKEIELINKIIKEKGIGPHDLSHFLGLGWNIEENIFSLFIFNKAIGSYTRMNFQSGKFLNLITVNSVKDFEIPLPGIDKSNVSSVAKVVVDNKMSHYHFRFKGFFVPFLSGAAGVINIKHFQEFRQPMASMELIDANNYTVHYP